MSRLGTIARTTSLAFAVCACLAYIVHQQRSARGRLEQPGLADDSPSTSDEPPVLLPSTKNPNVRLAESPLIGPWRASE